MIQNTFNNIVLFITHFMIQQKKKHKDLEQNAYKILFKSLVE